jgi:hypothetical protein
MVRREREPGVRLWNWLRLAVGALRAPRPVPVPQAPPVYVVGLHRSCEHFIRWTGQDPKGFRIITSADRLRGLPQGITVVLIRHPSIPLEPEILPYLHILKAQVKILDLDWLREDPHDLHAGP